MKVLLDSGGDAAETIAQSCNTANGTGFWWLPDKHQGMSLLRDLSVLDFRKKEEHLDGILAACGRERSEEDIYRI